jgi:hypothetical protein
MDDLEDRLDRDPQPWVPDVGEKLIGTIVELGERDSRFGDDPYPVVHVLDADGRELVVHAYPAVLRDELARQRPTVGDRIGVRFIAPPDDARNYARFRVLVEHADGNTQAVDWEAQARAAAHELGSGVESPLEGS